MKRLFRHWIKETQYSVVTDDKGSVDIKSNAENRIVTITGMVSYFNAPANNIISIDDSTNYINNSAKTLVENVNVNHSGAVDVNAYHKDNIYATNIAAGDVNINARDDHKLARQNFE